MNRPDQIAESDEYRCRDCGGEIDFNGDYNRDKKDHYQCTGCLQCAACEKPLRSGEGFLFEDKDFSGAIKSHLYYCYECYPTFHS